LPKTGSRIIVTKTRCYLRLVFLLQYSCPWPAFNSQGDFTD